MVAHAAWAGHRLALPLLGPAQVAFLYSGAATATAAVLLFHRLDPGIVRGRECGPASGARYVPALGARVRGYDHYCAWVDATIGGGAAFAAWGRGHTARGLTQAPLCAAGNHRAFHAFLALIATTGALFATAACQAHCVLVAGGAGGSWPAREAAAQAVAGAAPGAELQVSLVSLQASARGLTCTVATLWHGVSTPLLFAALHVALAVVPVAALLAWQVLVVSRGQTTYTLRQRQRGKEGVPAPSLRALAAFYAGRNA